MGLGLQYFLPAEQNGGWFSKCLSSPLTMHELSNNSVTFSDNGIGYTQEVQHRQRDVPATEIPVSVSIAEVTPVNQNHQHGATSKVIPQPHYGMST
ncbi:MAG: hypothetical protein QF619_02105 [Candidatus Binatia bacterium]|jgi:hypothetical protein|nr:hypothetical protein [Candidatus Binatia bacterium]